MRRKFYSSPCIEIQKDQNENYNPAKPLIFIKNIN